MPPNPDGDPEAYPRPDKGTHDQDFDDSANALWTLYGQEAKNYDQATIKDIKSDMDGLLIFAGLYSAVLTAFIIDRNQTIQPTPALQSAFFQNQSVALLRQISDQLSSQASVPSDLPLPDFSLSPTASDVLVNIIWIISLVFSLSAALLATLVQQWARDHMHIYQLYGHPLKVARIRQYLHEGIENYNMRGIAEVVPGLVHISLLLFFVGLAVFFRNTYKSVGNAAVVLLTLYAFLYTIATLAPIVDPQCPYRTPFSRFVWYSWRRTRKRFCNDQFGPEEKIRLDTNMIKGQMQLAMECNEARKDRDKRSILWLVENLTYDVEVEPLASGIPGSLDAKWGLDVWTKGPKPEKKDHLFKRIGRLLDTCNDRGSFMNDEDWRKRSRACIETVASFAFCMDFDITAFSSMGKLLSDLGSVEKICEVSATTSNRAFASRWTCLSLTSTRTMLNSEKIQQCAGGTLSTLAALHLEGNGTSSERALRNAQMIDNQFELAWRLVEGLDQELKALGDRDRTGGRIQEALRRYEPKLNSIRGEFGLKRVDASISELQKQIDEVTHKLTRQIPGVVSDHLTGLTPVEQVFEFFANPARPQLLYPSQLLLGLCAISQQRSSRGYQDTVSALQAAGKIRHSLRPAAKQHRLMERQLWRLEDLRVGNAFGFTLELYFLSIRHILSTFTSPPKEIHMTLYVNTFKALTSDWQDVTESTGTLQILLNLVYDIAFKDRGIFSNFKYPDYVTVLLLDLLRRMISGQEDTYASDALKELKRDDLDCYDEEFRASAVFILDRNG